jgi:xanthosine utilization system XapX-like protein
MGADSLCDGVMVDVIYSIIDVRQASAAAGGVGRFARSSFGEQNVPVGKHMLAGCFGLAAIEADAAYARPATKSP